MATYIEDEKVIDYENILIITGMDDKDWLSQTKDNFPEPLNKKIYMRSKLNKIENLDSFHNALIIIDECHIAAEKHQTMSSILEEAGINNIDSLKSKQIRILQVSATPSHTLYNAEKWGDENHGVVTLKASDKYVGFQQFLDAERILDTTPDDFDEIETQIKVEFTTPKYHIFRVTKKFEVKLRDMIKKNTWHVKVHNSKTRENVDELFQIKPERHTFVLIKGFWRAGKRLNDKHMGIVYEQPTEIADTDVVTQGLAGRLCGNDKQTPGPGTPIIYCDMKSINDYVKWFNTGGDFKVSEYRSRHLKSNGEGKVTFRSSIFGDQGHDEGESRYEISEESFDTKELAKAWADEKLRPGPEYGSTFYGLYDSTGRAPGNTHIKYRGKLKELLSEQDARSSTLINIGANISARIMPVRQDIGQGANTSARIMPVRSDMGWGVADTARIMPVTADDNIKYIVIYKRTMLL
jgi:hypothetical protein